MKENTKEYRANFLWKKFEAGDGSIEEAAYEFANGRTEAYIKMWYGILTERIALKVEADSYGKGVTAGKKEALRYNEDEKLSYVKHAAYNEGFGDARSFFKK